MNRWCKILLISVVLLFLAPKRPMYAQDIITVKAAYMERFTRFIDWPDNNEQISTNQEFRFLILGENPFGDALEKLYKTTAFKGAKVKVLYSNDIQSISDSDMVYISGSMQNQIAAIVKLAKEESVLTVADTKSFAAMGVMINFFVDKELLRFEINRKQIEESELKVSHLLTNVAKTTN